jgi:hypothetical protein
VAPQTAPLVVLDTFTERGSLVLEDDATFVQAVAASKTHADRNPHKDMEVGTMQVLSDRLKRLSQTLLAPAELLSGRASGLVSPQGASTGVAAPPSEARTSADPFSSPC